MSRTGAFTIVSGAAAGALTPTRLLMVPGTFVPEGASELQRPCGEKLYLLDGHAAGATPLGLGTPYTVAVWPNG